MHVWAPGDHRTPYPSSQGRNHLLVVYEPDPPVGLRILERLVGLETEFPCHLLSMIICIIIFISERQHFWEVISSSILDILDAMVKDDDSVLPEAIIEDYDFPVDLRRIETQVSIVSLLSSQK